MAEFEDAGQSGNMRGVVHPSREFDIRYSFLTLL